MTYIMTISGTHSKVAISGIGSVIWRIERIYYIYIIFL